MAPKKKPQAEATRPAKGKAKAAASDASADPADCAVGAADADVDANLGKLAAVNSASIMEVEASLQVIYADPEFIDITTADPLLVVVGRASLAASSLFEVWPGDPSAAGSRRLFAKPKRYEPIR